MLCPTGSTHNVFITSSSHVRAYHHHRPTVGIIIIIQCVCIERESSSLVLTLPRPSVPCAFATASATAACLNMFCQFGVEWWQCPLPAAHVRLSLSFPPHFPFGPWAICCPFHLLYSINEAFNTLTCVAFQQSWLHLLPVKLKSHFNWNLIFQARTHTWRHARTHRQTKTRSREFLWKCQCRWNFFH